MSNFHFTWTLPTVPDNQMYTYTWAISSSGSPIPPRPPRPPPPPPTEHYAQFASPPPSYSNIAPPPPPSSPDATVVGDGGPPHKVLECPSKITFYIIQVPHYSSHLALWSSNNIRPLFKVLDVPIWTPVNEALKGLGAGQKGWAITEALSWAICSSERGPGSWTPGACVKFGGKGNPASIGEVQFVTVGGNEGRHPVFVVAHKI